MFEIPTVLKLDQFWILTSRVFSHFTVWQFGKTFILVGKNEKNTKMRSFSNQIRKDIFRENEDEHATKRTEIREE